jgi:aspartyl/asparaginyl beta-hydroxylase (cupin superfamily)
MASYDTPQLSPHTFAGMVERALMQRFTKIERVLESWRLLDQEYVHHQLVHGTQSYQLCHSYVPGLTVQEFWNTQEYSWCRTLQSKYTLIRDEFRAVTADRDRLIQNGNNVWASALDDAVVQAYGDGWSTLVLMNRGVWDPVNVQLFPATAQALAEVPAVEVFFASMQPHSRIAPHSDFTNFVLTSHLAIDIPYSGEGKCRLTVGEEERQWINGQVTLFDTSIMHDAVNESDQTRYILMMRVWHPDLSLEERQALQWIYDALECPEIVTARTEEERSKAEREYELKKAFPVLGKGMGRKPGFARSRTGSSNKKRSSKRR